MERERKSERWTENEIDLLEGERADRIRNRYKQK